MELRVSQMSKNDVNPIPLNVHCSQFTVHLRVKHKKYVYGTGDIHGHMGRGTVNWDNSDVLSVSYSDYDVIKSTL